MHINLNARGASQGYAGANPIAFFPRLIPQKFIADRLKLPA
jgi:hypothetical protein